MGCAPSNCCSDKKDYSLVGVEKDKTRQFTKNFKGPVEERSCTDVFCCILFVVFIIIFLIISIWAFSVGDIHRLSYPTDSEGKVCGIDYPDRPYLFFFDLTQCVKSLKHVKFQCLTTQVCVKRCPKGHFLYKSPTSEVLENMVCKDGGNGIGRRKTVKELVETGECAAYVLPSKGLFNRCIPKQIIELISKNNTDYTNFNEVYDAKGQKVEENQVKEGSKFTMRLVSFLETISSDLKQNRWAILGGIIAAVVFSLIYVILMRFTAKFVVWATMIIFFLAFIAAAIFSFYKYAVLRRSDDGSIQPVAITLNVASYLKIAKTWLVFGIISVVGIVIIGIILIFLRKHLKLAVGVIEETSRGLAQMLSIIIWPVFPFILTGLVIAYCIAVFASLASVVDPTSVLVNKTNENSSSIFPNMDCNKYEPGKMKEICMFVGYGNKKYIIYLQIFTLFMMFWLVNFIKALDEMSLSGSYAYYYFSSRDRENLMPKLPLLSSLRNALRYHLGTLAFGSLLISLLQMIRAFLEYLEHKLKTSQNPVASFFMKCLKCCFWCLEKFLRFLNRNAYIMTAIYGQNFCSAAANAFGLIFRNCVRVFVLDKVADFVMLIGKLVIVGLSIGIFMAVSGGSIELPDNLLSLAIVGVVSFLIATLFFSVFVMGIDTIFLCLLEDLERNDGSAEKPYWMSSQLLKAIDKHNELKPVEKIGEKSI